VIDSSPHITQTRSPLLLQVTRLHPDGEVTPAHGGLPLAGSKEGEEGKEIDGRDRRRRRFRGGFPGVKQDWDRICQRGKKSDPLRLGADVISSR
jgi:hypothetical protein